MGCDGADDIVGEAGTKDGTGVGLEVSVGLNDGTFEVVGCVLGWGVVGDTLNDGSAVVGAGDGAGESVGVWDTEGFDEGEVDCRPVG